MNDFSLNIKKRMSKKYIEEIDIFRGIAILGVVIIHTTGAEYTLDNKFIYLLCGTLDQLFAFSVPFFIFISGLVLSYNYNDRDINYTDFIKKRLHVILVPYLIWSTIYLLYKITILGNNINFLTAIKKVIIGSAEFHLYYIIILLQFYILFPIILKLILKFNKSNIKLISLIFIFNLLLIIVYYYKFNYFNENILKKMSIFWMFYFISGMIMGLNYDYYKNKISTISLTFVGAFFFIDLINLDVSYFSDGLLEKNIFWLRPQVLIYATLCLILAFKFINELKLDGYLKKLPVQFLRVLGKNSFGIYLSHILFLNLSLIIFNMLNINNRIFSFNIILFVVVLTISLWFVISIRKIPYGHLFVGHIRNNRTMEK